MFKVYLICSILATSVISSCTSEEGPKEVIKSWLLHKSAGECQQAFDLEVDSYHRIIDDYECEAFPLEIKDINCEIEGEAAVCGCYLSIDRKDTEQYYYDLKKVDGVWKVTADS